MMPASPNSDHPDNTDLRGHEAKGERTRARSEVPPQIARAPLPDPLVDPTELSRPDENAIARGPERVALEIGWFDGRKVVVVHGHRGADIIPLDELDTLDLYIRGEFHAKFTRRRDAVGE